VYQRKRKMGVFTWWLIHHYGENQLKLPKSLPKTALFSEWIDKLLILSKVQLNIVELKEQFQLSI